MNRMLLLSLLLTGYCSSPAGWRKSAYLGGQGTVRPFFNSSGWFSAPDDSPESDSPSPNIVRVRIHAGRPVSIQGQDYRFQGAAGVRSGSGSFTPDGSGWYSSRSPFVISGKNYRGRLKIQRHNTGSAMEYVLYINEDDYLTSVLAHEMSPSWPAEALKAQAVVARTYLYIQRRPESSFDIGNDTSHQVFGGEKSGTEPARQAVVATRGQVLRYNGKLATVFFHSSCGGHIAASDEVWKSELPYLRNQKSRYCANSPVYKWQLSVPMSRLSSIAGHKVTSVSIGTRTKSGRVLDLVLKGSRTSRINAADLRTRLGATEFKSTLFDIRNSGSVLRIAGRGYGHGVGMCQWGAKAMAEDHRMNYKAILSHHFPGTQIDKGLVLAGDVRGQKLLR